MIHYLMFRFENQILNHVDVSDEYNKNCKIGNQDFIFTDIWNHVKNDIKIILTNTLTKLYEKKDIIIKK